MSRAPLDLESLRDWMRYAADADAANDSSRCKHGLVSLMNELEGRTAELRDDELRRAIAERLDESSLFLWDDVESLRPHAVRASELADMLVPGIVSAEHKAHLGRR